MRHFDHSCYLCNKEYSDDLGQPDYYMALVFQHTNKQYLICWDCWMKILRPGICELKKQIKRKVIK